MNTFLLLGMLCAAFLVGVRAEWDPEVEECVKELKLDRATIKAIDDLQIVPEDNHDYNNFLECFWKKEGTVDAEGHINWDKVDDLLLEDFRKEFGQDPKLSEFLTAAVVFGAVEQCKEHGLTGNSTGQKLAKLENCVIKEIQELCEKVGTRAEWDQKVEECVKELKLKKVTIKAIDNLEIVPEDNHDYNNFLECAWKKEGTVDDEGHINWDKVDDLLLEEFHKEFGHDPKLREFLTAAVVFGAVEQCKEHELTGDSTGQKLAKLHNCVVEEIQELCEKFVKKHH